MPEIINFVDELPGVAPRRGARPGAAVSPVLEKLRANPGQWAAVGTYDQAGQARRYGWGVSKRNADIEFTTRIVDGKYVTFLRAVNA